MRGRARQLAFWFAILLAFAGCGSHSDSTDDLHVQTVILPNGQQIRAEVMIRPADMARGMMFREHLDADKGMLFVHQSPGKHTYWMHNCKIPLDLIWMDSQRRITEIVPNAPPCRGEPESCPQYGGHTTAQYVLELAGGMAARYGLQVGDPIRF